MENWQWVSLVLCLFGMFKEFRPSEPFITEYLIDYHKFSKETVVQKIYPLGTYAYLGTLPIVFLFTDLLRYKPVIILEGLAFVSCYILLIWGNGLNALRVVEVLYGLASSTEVAYYTYIYAKVDRENFKKVTSYTYTAILIGNFVAAVLSQFFVSAKWLDYRELHYLTLAAVSVALLISIFLPSVKQSIYFHRNDNDDSIEEVNGNGVGANGDVVESGPDTSDNGVKQNGKINQGYQNQKKSFSQRLNRAFQMLWRDFKKAYSNPYVIKWSVWWAIASAGFLQIINYIQAMWEEIANYEENDIYNGGVDAIHTILSALLAIFVGHVTIPWQKWGESLLCIISLLQGGLLLWISQTHSIFVAYAGYIIFRIFYQVMITVASAEVAQGISQDSYGLIFGINRFLSLSLQSLLTLAVADENGFALGLRPQFIVYGSYFIALGVLFAIVVSYTAIRNACNNKDEFSVDLTANSKNHETRDNVVSL